LFGDNKPQEKASPEIETRDPNTCHPRSFSGQPAWWIWIINRA